MHTITYGNFYALKNLTTELHLEKEWQVYTVFCILFKITKISSSGLGTWERIQKYFCFL